jgi:hypothetical protein
MHPGGFPVISKFVVDAFFLHLGSRAHFIFTVFYVGIFFFRIRLPYDGSGCGTVLRNHLMDIEGINTDERFNFLGYVTEAYTEKENGQSGRKY